MFPWTLGLAILALAGMAAAPARAQEVVRHGLLEPSSTAWFVGEPLYARGGPDGDIAFSAIVGGVLFDDSSAVVVDGGTQELHFFGSDGTVSAVRGGVGQGPGEFRRIVSLVRTGGDTILVEDDGNLRFSRYVRSNLIDTERFPSAAMTLQFNMLGWHEGSPVFGPGSHPTQYPGEWLQGAVVTYRPHDDRFDTLTIFDIARTFTFPPTSPPDPFRPNGSVAVGGEALLKVRGDQPRVLILPLDDGPSRAIEWSVRDRHLTDSLWSEYVTYGEMRNISPDQLGVVARRAVVEPIPVVGEVRTDAAGNIWVAEFSPDRWHPHRYWLFRPDGDWMGMVVMPPRTQILDIGAQVVLAAQRDLFGSVTIVLLPLS